MRTQLPPPMWERAVQSDARIAWITLVMAALCILGLVLGGD